MERKEHTLLNVVSTVALQVITLLSGFMVPKLILSAFGSEVNGLVASITQFLGYISLIEGGVTSVILANLYKPLATKDNEKVSAVVSTADAFFKKEHLLSIFILVQHFFCRASLGGGDLNAAQDPRDLFDTFFSCQTCITKLLFRFFAKLFQCHIRKTI